MRLRLRLPTAVVAALTVPTLLLLAPPATADSNVVASGLNNPRHLSFSVTGDLYVAEAGTGGPAGPGLCITGGEGEVCFGLTGSVTKVGEDGSQIRVLTGLPSLAGEGGSRAAGPADIEITGRERFALSLGLGADPHLRASLPIQGEILGTLQVGKLGRGMTTLADLAGYEARENPGGGVPDTNPVGITRYRGGYLVADAGGNVLNQVRHNGTTTTRAVFPNTMVQNPFAPPGALMPMQAVPTSVVIGPDGAMYVSQLTGFPFPAGGAVIWRITRHGTPTVHATGLTNVTDLAFDGRQLYAVQISSEGLLNGPIGSIARSTPGRHPRRLSLET